MPRARPRTIDRDIFDRFTRHLEVVAIGAVDGEANWNSLRLRQYAPLRSAFAAVRGIWPGFFPRRAAPSTSLHPSTASSSRCLSMRRRPTIRVARTLERRRLRSIRRIVGAPKSCCTSRCRSTRSTECRFAARTRWRSSPSDSARVNYGSQEDAAFRAVTAARSCSTARQESSSYRRWRPVPSRHNDPRDHVAQRCAFSSRKPRSFRSIGRLPGWVLRQVFPGATFPSALGLGRASTTASRTGRGAASGSTFTKRSECESTRQVASSTAAWSGRIKTPRAEKGDRRKLSGS